MWKVVQRYIPDWNFLLNILKGEISSLLRWREARQTTTRCTCKGICQTLRTTTQSHLSWTQRSHISLFLVTWIFELQKSSLPLFRPRSKFTWTGLYLRKWKKDHKNRNQALYKLGSCNIAGEDCNSMNQVGKSREMESDMPLGVRQVLSFWGASRCKIEKSIKVMAKSPARLV